LTNYEIHATITQVRKCVSFLI